MPNLPIRNLGQFGVVTDVNPYDLPINGISKANNVRFINGKIERSNVFRSVLTTTPTITTPVFTFSIKQASDFDRIGVAGRDGKIITFKNGATTDVTRSGWTPTNSDLPYTYTYLQGIAYVNRADHVPWYMAASGTSFADLTNWTSTWRCASLRAYKDYLIALNITKSASNYPTMVKWSDITQYGAVPPSWDETDPTVSAGENTIGDMKTPIVDGMPLKDVFIIYSEDQIWLMEDTGNSDIFRFRKLFDNLGVMNTNCVVEIEGKHFVFGKNDIFVHDGSSFESIANGRVRKYIFDNLNTGKFGNCFVQHNPMFREIIFAYTSGDADAGFTSTTYANRGAVFNYSENTWSFIDLPNVTSMTLADIDTGRTYATVSSKWDTFAGTWYNQEDGGQKALFASAPISADDGITSSRLYGYDSAITGNLPYEVSTQATKNAFIERIGIDIDETQEELRAYKVINTIHPQVRCQFDDQSVNFSFAGYLYPQSTPSYGSSLSFTPSSDYKVNTREGGRYLAWRMTTDDYNGFELTGFDASVVSTGRR